jgi:hypothetical protein
LPKSDVNFPKLSLKEKEHYNKQGKKWEKKGYLSPIFILASARFIIPKS